MYKCTLPSEHKNLKILDEAFRYSSGTPVIVFLDAVSILQRIKDSTWFSPHSSRLERVQDELLEGRLVLPIVYFNGAAVHVSQGRHRTYALLKSGEGAVPYLTESTMVDDLLERHRTTAGIANYDLSGVPYPVIK